MPDYPLGPVPPQRDRACISMWAAQQGCDYPSLLRGYVAHVAAALEGRGPWLTADEWCRGVFVLSGPGRGDSKPAGA